MILATTPTKTQEKSPEEKVVREKSEYKFICTGGSLNSSFLVFGADAQSDVYPSLISLVNEADSRLVTAIEEFEPLFNISESVLKVIFRAQEYERTPSGVGGWVHNYYLGEIDYLNRKISMRVIGEAPQFNHVVGGKNLIHKSRSYIRYIATENKIFLPLKKDNKFYFAWFSLESGEVLSYTDLDSSEFHNPTLVGRYLIFDRYNKKTGKFSKSIFSQNELTLKSEIPLGEYEQMGPTFLSNGAWFWLAGVGEDLKVIYFSQQKAEQKIFDLKEVQGFKVFSGAKFAGLQPQITSALVPVELVNANRGEIHELSFNLETGAFEKLGVIPYPENSKSVSEQLEFEMVLKDIFSFKSNSEIFASFVMPDSSTRIFRTLDKKTWSGVSRASCNEVRAWKPKELSL